MSNGRTVSPSGTNRRNISAILFKHIRAGSHRQHPAFARRCVGEDAPGGPRGRVRIPPTTTHNALGSELLIRTPRPESATRN